MSRLHRLLTTLVGELPPAPSPPADPRLPWLVGAVLGLVAYLELVHDLRGDPLVRGAWRGLLFGAVPLAAGLCWDLRGRRGPLALAALGGLLALVPTALRLVGPPKAPLLLAHLGPAFGAALLGCGLLLLAARRGGACLAAWGLSAGDWRWWAPRTGIASLLVVGGVLVAMHLSPDLREFYPWYRPARHHADELLRQQAGIGLDFLGWEFLFRGFLLFGLARRGDVHLAILTQAMAFFLLHQGKPDVELFLSLPGGLLAGWFCWRARSFAPLWILHTVQLVSVNLVAFWLRNG